jgi:hypothetical protein
MAMMQLLEIHGETVAEDLATPEAPHPIFVVGASRADQALLGPGLCHAHPE